MIKITGILLSANIAFAIGTSSVCQKLDNFNDKSVSGVSRTSYYVQAVSVGSTGLDVRLKTKLCDTWDAFPLNDQVSILNISNTDPQYLEVLAISKEAMTSGKPLQLHLDKNSEFYSETSGNTRFLYIKGDGICKLGIAELTPGSNLSVNQYSSTNIYNKWDPVWFGDKSKIYRCIPKNDAETVCPQNTPPSASTYYWETYQINAGACQ